MVWLIYLLAVRSLLLYMGYLCAHEAMAPFHWKCGWRAAWHLTQAAMLTRQWPSVLAVA
jgi:hypothetical protein